MNLLERVQRIAEVEFAAVVTQTDLLGVKLRILLTDTSYIDVWASSKLQGRFGYALGTQASRWTHLSLR